MKEILISKRGKKICVSQSPQKKEEIIKLLKEAIEKIENNKSEDYPFEFIV